MRLHDILGIGILAGALALAAALASSAAAHATPLKVLYSFCSETSCTDGERPDAAPVMDTAGNIYGTTQEGGANGRGSVFKLSAGKETVLYSFCSASGCSDGEFPEASLIVDAHGNLFGTTVYGGAHAEGTVFEIPAGGTEKVLYSFCAMASCGDGEGPHSGLIMDAQGNLYGTTQLGGTTASAGVVFKLARSGKETVLYAFCKTSTCRDGAFPLAGLIMDKTGNLYGTTTQGGAHNGTNCSEGCGTVFQLTPKRRETVLYSFCALSKCKDGSTPGAALVMDANGNLYGTTEYGGSKTEGTVFELPPKGSEMVLYSFCLRANCSDGRNPQSGLLMDASANLYGVTSGGGTPGVVFSLTPPGKETILHAFCAGCDDGNDPIGLTTDGKGKLYGTTYAGGTADLGTIFELAE